MKPLSDVTQESCNIDVVKPAGIADAYAAT